MGPRQGLGAICLCGLTCLAAAAQEITFQPSIVVPPQRAWKILTQSGEGAARRQRVLSEVTGKILDPDRSHVRIEEIRNPSDVFDREELYVVFPAQEIDGLPGYYILSLAPKARLAGELSYLHLDTVAFLRSGSFRLSMSLQANHEIDLWLYYSPNPKMEPFWAISEVREPKLVHANLIDADPLPNRFIEEIPASILDGRWHDEVALEIDPLFSRQGAIIHLCQDLLAKMDSVVGTGEGRLVWDASKVKSLMKKDPLEELLAVEERAVVTQRYIAVEFHGVELTLGSPIVSALERTVAFKLSDGKLVPGKLAIGLIIRRSK